MALNLITITGSLYHPSTGAKITSGQLLIRPSGVLRNDTKIVTPVTVAIAVPGTGDLSFQLVASSSVPYIVEFDPDPNSSLPLAMRSGYFKNTWTVPSSGPVNINAL